MLRLSPVPALLAATMAALYIAPGLSANAQALGPEDRTAIEALREGEMRKLTVHEAPRSAATAAFRDRHGAEHSLAETDGKVRLVNFWATWCAPCRKEKPALDALAADLAGPDFEVIAVATGRHELDAIDRFNEEVGVEHLATYLDPENELSRELAVPGLPVTVLLNREGEEIARLMGGADWNGESARAIIDHVIALGE